MDDDISYAVGLLGLPPDLRPVAVSVAREICDQARVAFKESRNALTPTHVRDKLEAVVKHAKALRKALENQAVREGLIHAFWGRDESGDASGADRALAEIPRVLDALPSDLRRLELSAPAAIDTLGLKGRHGHVNATWTYRLSPEVIFVRMAMYIWLVAMQTKRLPSEKNTRFKKFLDALLLAALPDRDDQDWSRAIRTARGQDQTEGRLVARIAMRLEAEDVVLPLVNAIQDRKTD